MREQVCIYMCPWPRIQGAMMDDQTMTVAYREWRGEPRGRGTRRRAAAERSGADRADVAEAEVRAAGPKTGGTSPLLPLPGVPTGVGGPIPAKEGYGDCIDCNACVNVCPMGIDIRDGQQLACITCALCIDACNEVMDKVDKPRGLIGYVTLADGERERAGAAPVPVWRRIVRPRVIALHRALGRHRRGAASPPCCCAPTCRSPSTRCGTRSTSPSPTARSATPMPCACAT